MEKEKKSTKLNKKMIFKIIILLVLIAVVIGIFILVKNLSKEKVAGNYANMGLVLQDGGTIYYNKYEEGIIKVKSGKEYQITEETAYSMNLIGDTIYYLTVTDTNTIAIKYVKTNGDELTTIKEIGTSISKIYVQDGYIYYVTNQNSNGLVKINLENYEEERINFANIKDFVVDEDIIYYVDSTNTLNSINFDGSDSQIIETSSSLSKIQILGKWIYFYSDSENALCKIKKDGTGEKVVSTFVNSEIYNVTSKKIYYYDSTNKKICASSLNGSKSEEIVSVSTSSTKINVVNGVIYYLDKSKDETQIYQMYRIKTSGRTTNSIEY